MTPLPRGAAFLHGDLHSGNVGGGTYTIGVRPEHLRVGADGIPGEVTVVEELGSEAFLHVTFSHQGEPTILVVRADGETAIGRGAAPPRLGRRTSHDWRRRGET